MSEGTETLDQLECHIAPCCSATILCPPGFTAEATEAVKDHMAECMVGAITHNAEHTPQWQASVDAVRAMFE